MWRYRVRKFGSLSPGEMSELVGAQLALIAAAVLVWTRPNGRLIHPDTPTASEEELSAEAVARAQRLSLAVQRAGEHGLFRPSCLVRSVALQRMLWRGGIRSARIHIGVRGGKDEFVAHAWVQCGSLILGDKPYNVQGFEPFSRVEVIR